MGTATVCVRCFSGSTSKRPTRGSDDNVESRSAVKAESCMAVGSGKMRFSSPGSHSVRARDFGVMMMPVYCVEDPTRRGVIKHATTEQTRGPLAGGDSSRSGDLLTTPSYDDETTTMLPRGPR
eukprot:3373229-Rhodomonas_salina.1